MKRMVLFANVPAAALCGAIAAAAETGLAIVPFAVPVAVPVAVVQQPTLFYGVSAYAPPIVTSPTATTPSAGPTSPVDDPYRAQVAPLLTQRCAECHRGSQAQGGLVLFDVDGRLLDKLPRQLIVEQATVVEHAAGAEAKQPPMPPGDRVPLASDEQALVRKWAVLPKRLSY